MGFWFINFYLSCNSQRSTAIKLGSLNCFVIVWNWLFVWWGGFLIIYLLKNKPTVVSRYIAIAQASILLKYGATRNTVAILDLWYPESSIRISLWVLGIQLSIWFCSSWVNCSCGGNSHYSIFIGVRHVTHTNQVLLKSWL